MGTGALGSGTWEIFWRQFSLGLDNRLEPETWWRAPALMARGRWKVGKAAVGKILGVWTGDLWLGT